jgi:hypothetical protein
MGQPYLCDQTGGLGARYSRKALSPSAHFRGLDEQSINTNKAEIKTMEENAKFMMRRADIALAIQEIERDFLEVIQEDIARLIFLASTRDYQAGRYQHDVMAFLYSEEMTDEALAACHRKVFDRVSITPLPELVWQLNNYLVSVIMPQSEVIQLWRKHTPYHILPPRDCDPLAAEMFLSNIKVALAILEERSKTELPAEQYQISSNIADLV